MHGNTAWIPQPRILPSLFFPKPHPTIQTKPALPEDSLRRQPGQAELSSPSPLAVLSRRHGKPLEGPEGTLSCRRKGQHQRHSLASNFESSRLADWSSMAYRVRPLVVRIPQVAPVTPRQYSVAELTGLPRSPRNC